MMPGRKGVAMTNLQRCLFIRHSCTQYRSSHARFQPALVLAILCMISLFSRAHAQLPVGVDGRAYGTVEADGLHVHFELYNEPWTYAYWYPPAVTAFSVYHRAFGASCGEWELIEFAVPWTWSDQSSGGPTGPHMTFDLLDATAQPGIAYAYMARALDATYQPIADYGDAPLGMATHGTAPLARASLYSGPGGCGLSSVNEVWFCTGTWCDAVPPASFTFAAVSPEISQYINTGTVLHLYGTISGYWDLCGANQAIATFTAGPPGECIVATRQRTWGYVKSLYR